MSILKKLNKAKQRNISQQSQRPPITKEQAEEINKELSTQQYNAVFKLSGATFSLWQRLATGIDTIMSLLRVTGLPMSRQDAYMVTLAEAALKAMTALDDHVRHSYIIMEDGVSGMDDVHSQMYDIINKMDNIPVNTLNVLEKVVDVMSNSARYIWIDDEQVYKDNMQVAIQYGIDLANKNDRKKASAKDVELFISTHTKDAKQS